jgi:hypothetical protein
MPYEPKGGTSEKTLYGCCAVLLLLALGLYLFLKNLAV